MHLDAQGEVYAVNGTYEPTPVGVATTPALDEAAALQTVVADLEARGRWAPLPGDVAAWLGVEEATMERVLYPDPEQGMRLAYDVSLHPNLLEWYTYLCMTLAACGESAPTSPAPDEAGTIQLEVRLHLLQSSVLDALDVTLTDDEVRVVIQAVNEVWACACRLGSP